MEQNIALNNFKLFFSKHKEYSMMIVVVSKKFTVKITLDNAHIIGN